MDNLHDIRHKEREGLYQALDNLVQLPRFGALGMQGSVRLWVLADALKYIPHLENAMGAVEERNRFLECRNADLVRHMLIVSFLLYC
jgi:hypothetical protein